MLGFLLWKLMPKFFGKFCKRQNFKEEISESVSNRCLNSTLQGNEWFWARISEPSKTIVETFLEMSTSRKKYQNFYTFDDNVWNDKPVSFGAVMSEFCQKRWKILNFSGLLKSSCNRSENQRTLHFLSKLGTRSSYFLLKCSLSYPREVFRQGQLSKYCSRNICSRSEVAHYCKKSKWRLRYFLTCAAGKCVITGNMEAKGINPRRRKIPIDTILLTQTEYWKLKMNFNSF